VNELRELTVYNLNGFLVSTVGLYRPKTNNNRFVDWLKLKASGHFVDYIFHKNLQNIKKEVEGLS